MEATIPQQPDIKPQEGLGFFRYAWNFTKTLIKDNKFFTRIGGLFSGINLIAQGVIGGLVLISPPLATKITHFIGYSSLTAAKMTAALVAMPLAAQVGCFAGFIALAAIGVTAIGLGFPGAWKSMEHICAKTFPKFNPLKRIRTPFRARFKKSARKNAKPQNARTGFLGRLKSRMKEHHTDVFLSAVALEGATVGAVAWGIAIAPTVMALPVLTVGGGLFLVAGTWTIGTAFFDIYNSTKTLIQSYGTHRRTKKAAKIAKQAAKTAAPAKKHAPPPQEEKARPLPAATTDFNKSSVPDATPEKDTLTKDAAPEKTPPENIRPQSAPPAPPGK